MSLSTNEKQRRLLNDFTMLSVELKNLSGVIQDDLDMLIEDKIIDLKEAEEMLSNFSQGMLKFYSSLSRVEMDTKNLLEQTIIKVRENE